MRRDGARQLLHRAASRIIERGRARNHVAVHVAATAERGDERVIDAAKQRLHLGLADPVELKALSRGDAKRIVGVLAAQVVHGEILVGGEFAARKLEPNHEHVRLADAGLVAVLAGVPVFLLVAAVELDELGVGLADVIEGSIGEFFRDGAAEESRVFFHALDGGQFDRGFGDGLCGHGRNFHARVCR